MTITQLLLGITLNTIIIYVQHSYTLRNESSDYEFNDNVTFVWKALYKKQSIHIPISLESTV